ncbi:MAG: chromosome segregation protein SMC [Desulfobacterales bacterium]|jgi:chromosome segregation protein
MKVKKLEITGFKSFYDRSTIEFPPGISAVVGPNGCGKSNIIDAIRWVMGEQSLKQLRGKSKEDIIFSGANGRAAMNMAEVSLTLANDNGNAPEELKDFTEINLTRRLYRSGETAYLLNRQPCRLKDIHNVFLGSGLGAKSYAVIQQGNIGAITDADPIARRYFIEEAAGTTRYKNRKVEALRKVEITNQNLLRVSDIISEIKRQMASLKRQARKAELYNNYQNRIKTLDVYLGIHYYDNYSNQIEQIERLLQELKDTDLGHSSELKKLDAAVEEIKLKRWQKNQEISDQKSQKYETQRTIDRNENDLAHLRSEIERLTKEAAELTSALQDLEEKNRDLISEITQVEQENANLREQIETERRNLSQQRLATEEISAKLSALNQELDSIKSELMNLMTQEAQFKNICQNASNNKESLQRRLKRTDEEEVLAKRQIKAAQLKESQFNNQLETIKQEIEELDQRTAETRKLLDDKTADLARQVKLAQTFELERTTAKSKYNTLKKMEDNFEWYRDGVKAIMQAQSSALSAKNPKVADQGSKSPAISAEMAANILELMADVIEADSTYETAIEAVLGESLQYIIVKDQQTGVQAIDYLQAHNAGRSGFIPVAAVKPTYGNGNNAPDPSKLLLNHITVKKGFEPIARMLLGDVIFTETIHDALELFNKNGKVQRIVTKNGDVISQQGILIGGSQDKLSGILSKKHEIKELERQDVVLLQKLESARVEQNSLESVVRGLESDLQKHIELKNRMTENEIEAEKALYKASEDLKSANRHLEIVQLEQEQLLGEASDIDDELSKYHQALAEITQKINSAQHQVALKTEAINTVGREVEESNQSVVDLKLKLTALDAKLENSNNSLRRLKEFHGDGLNRLEQLSQDIMQKTNKAEISKQKISEKEQHLSEMYSAMEHIDASIERNEADYEDIDARLKGSDDKISAIKSEREKSLEKLRMLELEQSQNRLNQENTANRLEDRYQYPFSALKNELIENEEALQITADRTIEEIETDLAKSREKILKIVDVNLGAIKEYEQLKERYDFLQAQRNDLFKAIEDLHKVINKINRITQEKFTTTFDLINAKLKEVFPRLFDGGEAKLVLTEPQKPLESGVDFMIHPPGKKLTRLSLLSGGEKALSAIAFIFSIFLIKPASFCLLDEIDAPLDDANIFRFNDLLKIIGENSQIIMITHNKRTMEFADTLFGITMEQKGISKIVSVNFLKPGESN